MPLPPSAQAAQDRQQLLNSGFRPTIRGAHFSGAYGTVPPSGIDAFPSPITGMSTAPTGVTGAGLGGVDPFSGPSLKQRTTPNNLGRGYGSTSQPFNPMAQSSISVPNFSSINNMPGQNPDPFQTNPFLKKKPFTPVAGQGVQPGPPDPLTLAFQSFT